MPDENDTPMTGGPSRGGTWLGAIVAIVGQTDLWGDWFWPATVGSVQYEERVHMALVSNALGDICAPCVI